MLEIDVAEVRLATQVLHQLDKLQAQLLAQLLVQLLVLQVPLRMRWVAKRRVQRL